ncbi:MAG: hypothetical protein QM764_06085 [Chitinophagaceae bacterium]
MASKGYFATKKSITRYEFVSIGPNGQIKKRIEFTPLRKRNYFNVAFGDVMKNGRISDTVYSNNQDIVRIMATVVETMKDFLKENKAAKLVFTGSRDDRTAFYKNILGRYHKTLFANYTITALSKDENDNYQEVEFDFAVEKNYSLFIIKNKM